jgi:predicted Zn-dependent peptidase
VSQTILSHTFGNGLVLLAQPMKSLQSAAFTFLVPAGCVYDPPERSGLASFACEMALRGAGERDSRQFVLDLDNLGVERSEAVFDSHTSYSGATLAENLPEALAIYAELLQRPRLPAEQLEASRAVMFQELRAVDDEPSQKAMIELRGSYYPKPWGRPSQGDEDSLAAIGDDDIRGFVNRQYRPNGTVLGVAGRVDWPQLKDCVERTLGAWRQQPEEPIVAKPAPIKYRHLDFSANQTQVGIAYPTVPYRDEQYFTAWGAVGVLSGGMSARLFTEVRERRGLCYSVHASYHSLRDLAGVFCYAGTSAERAQETLDVTIAELLRLAEGVETQEVVRLKARIKSSLIMQQESSSSRSSSLARDWYHLGRARTLEEVGREIDALTSEGISAYLAENPPRDFTIVTLGPAELEVPVGVS